MKLKNIIVSLIILFLLFGCVSKDDQIIKIKKISIKKVEAYIENIDNSFWLKSSNNRSIFYNFKIYFNENDINKDDIAYCRVYNKFNIYWTLHPDKNFNDKELSINGYRYYDSKLSNDGSILSVKDLLAVIMLTNGNYDKYNFNFDLYDDKTGNVQFVYNEDFTGIKDEANMQIIKRASIINYSKTKDEISITFSVDDKKVNNGYLWFYDRKLNYIGMTKKRFINSLNNENANFLNNGNKLNIDGKENIITINNDDIKYNKNFNYKDINSCFVVLIDGNNSKEKNKWEFRSISKKILFK